MYSWGDDTGTWKKPGAYDYGSARRTYLGGLADVSAKTGPRTYTSTTRPNSKLVATLDKVIESKSENPIVIGVDVTGSMSTWPKEIFDRLPLLYQTLSKYKPDTEIAFAAIGDATCDSFPLQVNNFEKETKLDACIKALYPEGGGGGGAKESYELFAYYLLNNAKVDNAKSPFLIIYGDEGFYENVDPKQVQHYIGKKPETLLDSAAVWAALKQKFDIYLLHKQYDSGGQDSVIVDQWRKVLGHEKVIPLYEPERAVDVAIGLIAKKWGEYGDFTKSLSARHDASEARSVHASLRHVTDVDALSTKSIVSGKKSGKKSMRLTDLTDTV
ncbi:MAG: hypothetical protein WC755_06240 [Candidatus Woesearchaeota archaeon]|jgi:hypothetical protein